MTGANKRKNKRDRKHDPHQQPPVEEHPHQQPPVEPLEGGHWALEGGQPSEVLLPVEEPMEHKVERRLTDCRKSEKYLQLESEKYLQHVLEINHDNAKGFGMKLRNLEMKITDVPNEMKLRNLEMEITDVRNELERYKQEVNFHSRFGEYVFEFHDFMAKELNFKSWGELSQELTKEKNIVWKRDYEARKGKKNITQRYFWTFRVHKDLKAALAKAGYTTLQWETSLAFSRNRNLKFHDREGYDKDLEVLNKAAQKKDVISTEEADMLLKIFMEYDNILSRG